MNMNRSERQCVRNYLAGLTLAECRHELEVQLSYDQHHVSQGQRSKYIREWILELENEQPCPACGQYCCNERCLDENLLRPELRP